jgi:hypothetical protein
VKSSAVHLCGQFKALFLPSSGEVESFIITRMKRQRYSEVKFVEVQCTISWHRSIVLKVPKGIQSNALGCFEG